MWKNLGPDLVRQRLIIEGTTEKYVLPKQIKDYLGKLAEVTNMKIVSGPVAYNAHKIESYGGWVYWENSGAHFYSYNLNPPLFSVDTYTCKPFSVKKAVEFTKEYFNPIEIVWKEVEV